MPTSFTAASTEDLLNALQTIDLGARPRPRTRVTPSPSSRHHAYSAVLATSLASGDTLAIQRTGKTLDGGGQYNGSFDYAGTVSIRDLTIQNAKAGRATRAASSCSGGYRINWAGAGPRGPLVMPRGLAALILPHTPFGRVASRSNVPVNPGSLIDALCSGLR